MKTLRSISTSSLVSGLLSAFVALSAVGTLAVPSDALARDITVTGPRGNVMNRNKSYDPQTGTVNSVITGPGGNTVTRNATRQGGTITGPGGQTTTRRTTVDPATGSSSSTFTGPYGRTFKRSVNR
jgi:hypothetical protein